MDAVDNRQPQRRDAIRRWARATVNYSTVILAGAISARLTMMTIDALVARNGGTPGGELFLPFYGALLPICGWYLRGAWERVRAARRANKRLEKR